MDSKNWNPDLPIYVQLRAKVIALILDGRVKEGDSIPSVRALAAEYRLHPMTAFKVYQKLAEDGVLESRRRLGMFVTAGARGKLLAEERKHFLAEEWPAMLQKIDRLDFTPEELLSQSRNHSLKQKKK
jgi:GntR family transcriptional regulator